MKTTLTSPDPASPHYSSGRANAAAPINAHNVHAHVRTIDMHNDNVERIVVRIAGWPREVLMRLLVSACFSAGSFASLPAQTIPVRQMDPPTASTFAPLGLFLGVKQLSDGRVFVDDAQRLRLLLFDSTLTNVAVIADTTGKAAFNYGDNPGRFTSYVGDSSLFFEQSSQTLLVLDAFGHVARITVAPKPTDIKGLPATMFNADAQGRLVYRGSLPRLPAAPVPFGDKRFIMRQSDSAPLVRADFDSRHVDTLAWLKMPKATAFIGTLRSDGSYAYDENRITPLSSIDEWTQTADGSIAIVRGLDYHMDWIAPDGRRRSTPKMPFDWIRVTDDDKRRLSDSARVAADKLITEMQKRAPASAPSRPGSLKMTIRVSATDGSLTAFSQTGKNVVVPLSEIPDYWPPVRFGSVAADLDGNVWILPTSAVQRAGGGIVYDVVNRSGQLFERVQMLPDRSIAGFGPNGIIYLRRRDSALVWHLEKSRVHR
ncbi:MAG: hypothetical protein ABJB74_16735 [Gemmatimonas sp.]